MQRWQASNEADHVRARNPPRRGAYGSAHFLETGRVVGDVEPRRNEGHSDLTPGRKQARIGALKRGVQSL